MSEREVVRFLTAITRDAALKRGLTEFAAARGFEFSPEELTEVQLDAIVGGKPAIGQPVDTHEREADRVADPERLVMDHSLALVSDRP